MIANSAEYVCQDSSGAWRIVGSRISLDSIVIPYWEGKSPEAIAEEFPALSSEMVYGAIAFYLCNKEAFDKNLQEQSSRWAELKVQSEAQNGGLLDRIRAAGLPRGGASS